MMTKKLIIISAVFVFISVVLFAWMQIRTLKQNSVTGNGVLTNDPGALIGNIGTPLDGPLFTEEAINFQNKIKQDIQAGTIPSTPYFSTESQIIDAYPEGLGASQIPYYQTLYNAETNEFEIFLFEFPLADTRKRAETYFLQKLGINEQQACMLRVWVGVTPFASESLAWKNLGLSFCPGATDLSPYTENTDGISNIEQEQPSDTTL